MKFNNLLFAFIILLFPILISCSNNQKKQTSENVNQVDSKPDQADAILVQKCQSDASISFSYYLPSSFKEGKKYPVLILFDPHGDSRFAIEKYKSAADKFEFILLSTDAIKNGINSEMAAHVMQTILASVATQLPVNPTRVYVGGFSGGARYAAMLAMSGSGIQGLMVAGAGFPLDSWKGLSPSVIIAAANDGDMNLPEIFSLDQIKNAEQRGRLLTFRDAGIHEWPSADKMEEMLAIFTAYGLRDSIETDQSKLDSVLSTYHHLDEKQYCKASMIYQSLFYERAIKSLMGLSNVSTYKSNYLKINSSSDFINAKQSEVKLIAEEGQIKNQYYAAMGTKDTSWWNLEMNELNSSIKNEKNILKQSQLMRIRNGLSLMCYMNLSKTMNANSNQDAYYLAVLYRNIDPENAESWFLSAVMEARTQNKSKAIYFLQKAIDVGFKERQRVNQTPEFNSLLGEPSFQDLINRIPN